MCREIRRDGAELQTAMAHQPPPPPPAFGARAAAAAAARVQSAAKTAARPRPHADELADPARGPEREPDAPPQAEVEAEGVAEVAEAAFKRRAVVPAYREGAVEQRALGVANEEDVPATNNSTCIDVPGAFGGLAVCTGDECGGGVDFLAPFLGGGSAACQMTLAEIRSRGPYCLTPFIISVSVTYLYEVCPATCSVLGSSPMGCRVPPPLGLVPPPPAWDSPPAPPANESTSGAAGFVNVSTTSQLRRLIEATPRGSSLSLRLPAGSAFPLEGRPIVVGPIVLALISEGEGSVLDAQHLSRVLIVQDGASVTLKAVVLANGHAEGSGGGMQVWNGTVLLMGSVLVNSTAQCGGGAIFVALGTVIVADGSSIRHSSASTLGGAILCVRGRAMVTNGSTLVNSTAHLGGAILSYLSTVVLTNFSLIVGSRAGLVGGSILSWDGQVLIGGASMIRRSSAVQTAGAIYVSNGVLTIADGSSIVDSRSVLGGAVHVADGNAWCAITGGSAIIDATAMQGGGISMTAGRFSLLYNSSLIGCRAATDGGAMHLNGGAVRIAHGSSILDCSSEGSGGAISLNGGEVIVEGNSIVANSQSRVEGGAVMMTRGRMILTEASSVVNSSSSAGGAAAIYGGDLLVANRSRIDRAVATVMGGGFIMRSGNVIVTDESSVSNLVASLGGGFELFGGTLQVKRRSLIINCTAFGAGGAISLANGYVHVSTGSTIANAASGTSGGVIAIQSGSVWLSNSTVIGSAASEGGSVLYHPSSLRGDSPALAVFTHTEIWQSECGSTFALDGLMQVVLRNTSFEPLPSCDAPAVSSRAFSDEIALAMLTTSCGTTFTDPVNWVTAGVCSPYASCTPQPVNGTPLNGVTCQCSLPSFPNPELEFGDAPYIGEGGCIRPKSLEDAYTVQRYLSVALFKPYSRAKSENLTVVIDGEDTYTDVYWRLTNDTDMSRWLALKQTSGRVTDNVFEIELTFTAAGLRESVEPYQGHLIVILSHGASSYGEQAVPITLFVQTLTSYVTWGFVASVQTCSADGVAATVDGTCTVGSSLRVPFTACDEDDLPVNHQLPSQNDGRRPSVQLSADGESSARAIPYAYIGEGHYEAIALPLRHGPFTLELALGGFSKFLTGLAVCPDGRVPVLDGRCGCASGYFQLASQEPCELCTPASTSSVAGAIGPGSCNICREGFYKLPGSTCVECPEGAICAFNTSQASMQVERGYWRLASTASKLYKCAGWQNGRPPVASSCVGGTHGSDICAAMHTGPLCQLCVNESHYFHHFSGSCVECPSRAATASVLVVLLVCFTVVLAAARCEYARGCCAFVKLGRRSRRIRFSLMTYSQKIGLISKLKLFLSFSQVVSGLDDTFKIGLPESWFEAIKVFSIIGQIDWTHWLVDGDCIIGRGMANSLVLRGLVPLAVVVAMPLMGVLLTFFLQRAHTAKKNVSRLKLVAKGALAGLPFSLFLSYCLTPSVSIRIFRAWDCIAFASSDEEERSFLELDYSVSCDGSPEYEEVIILAWILVAIWPIGMVLVYAALLFPCRDILTSENTDTMLVRATAFLHRDYRAPFFWWEIAFLVQRTVLLDWIILINRKRLFFRLWAGLVISVAYLVALLICQPYRRKLDGTLASGGQLLIVGLFLGGLVVLQYTTILDDPEGSPELALRLIGLHSADEAALIMIVIALLFFLFFLAALLAESYAHHLRAKLESKWSSCSIEPPQVKSWRNRGAFACFVSHYKNESASDARYLHDSLRKMLHAPVFIDSVTLTDLRKLLTDGVHQSDTVLLLGTKGVLSRPWCLIELLETVRRRIPVIIVQVQNGGFTMEGARKFVDKLPEEMQRLNPSGFQFLLRRLDNDLTELQESLSQILVENENRIMPFDSRASDLLMVSQMKDIVEMMALRTGRTIEWRDHEMTRRTRFFIPAWRTNRQLDHASPFVYISCARDDILVRDVRVLRSELSIKLDRYCAITGKDEFADLRDSCQLMVVMLTRSFLTDPKALLEVYQACLAGVSLVTVEVMGYGYDFAEAAKVFEDFPRSLAEMGLGAIEELSAGLSQGTDLAVVGEELYHNLTSIIALAWTPPGSKNQLDALIKEIVSRVPRKRTPRTATHQPLPSPNAAHECHNAATLECDESAMSLQHSGISSCAEAVSRSTSPSLQRSALIQQIPMCSAVVTRSQRDIFLGSPWTAAMLSDSRSQVIQSGRGSFRRTVIV